MTGQVQTMFCNKTTGSCLVRATTCCDGHDAPASASYQDSLRERASALLGTQVRVCVSRACCQARVLPFLGPQCLAVVCPFAALHAPNLLCCHAFAAGRTQRTSVLAIPGR